MKRHIMYLFLLSVGLFGQLAFAADPDPMAKEIEQNTAISIAGSAFSDAAKNGDLASVQQFLQDANFNVNNSANRSAITNALCYGHLEIARLLLEHDAYVNTIHMGGSSGKVYTPLHYAVFSSNPDIVAMLIQMGTPIVLATNLGDPLTFARTLLNNARGNPQRAEGLSQIVAYLENY